MKILLPSIRADFRLVDGYEYRSKGAPLNVPVCALAGTNDKHVPLEEVDGWAIHTTNSFTTKRFTGDHFFIESQRFSVLEFVRDEILGLSHNSNAVQTSCARK
jgi:medium-chain acyl-[acyl-carrier-protein] hydrolase